MVTPRDKIKEHSKITIFIGKELKDWLKETAFKTNRTMGSFIREALEDYKGKTK